MAEGVYFLCALASAVCAVLLTRGYLRTRSGLLLWSSLCFFFFALSNAILVVDMALGARADLTLFRTIPAFIGAALMLVGLIWESR